MIFLRLCCVRMYAAFYPKRRYIENSDRQSLYFRAEIKASEIRKEIDRRQKWFHGIALLGTGTQMC